MGEVTSITYNQAHNLVEMHSTLFILNFRSEEQENKIERLEMQVEAQGVLLKEIGEGLCLVISSKATLQVIPVGRKVVIASLLINIIAMLILVSF